MHNTILAAHSHFRWLVFIIAIFAIVLPFVNNKFSSKSKLPGLFFMIVCDIQLLMGLTMYLFTSPFGVDAFLNNGMGAVMKTPEIRKIAIEHFVLMLLAISLVHIGYSKIKKSDSQEQVKKLSLKFFGGALALILLGFPYFKFAHGLF